MLDQVDRGGLPNPERVHLSPAPILFASSAETGFEPGLAPGPLPTTGTPRNSPGVEVIELLRRGHELACVESARPDYAFVAENQI